jgi:hypothetical protein
LLPSKAITDIVVEAVGIVIAVTILENRAGISTKTANSW